MKQFIILMSVASLLVAGEARAVTRTVTTLGDSGAGSLRDTIGAADAGDVIEFSVTGIISLTSGQLSVSKNITINGPGANLLTIQRSLDVQNFAFRIFYISNGPTVKIAGLTLARGLVAETFDGNGGGIMNHGDLTLNDCRLENNQVSGRGASNAGDRGDDGVGGAICNLGTLVLNRCTLSNNAVVGGAGGRQNSNGVGGEGGLGFGGAINNSGTLVLNRCTLSNNAALGGAGGGTGITGVGGNGGDGFGGAIWNFSNGTGTMTMNNCTITGNTGSGGAGGLGRFGGNGGKGVAGIYSYGVIVVTATTISGNTGTGGAAGSGGKGTDPGIAGTAVGGVSAVNYSANTIRNTIIAGNTGPAGPDAEGSFTSEGYNLIGVGDFSSGFNGPGDQVGTSAAPIDPKLSALANNGGNTDTMALAFDSPALDGGKSFGLIEDQRGSTRPFDRAGTPNASGGDASDIGAFEAGQSLQPVPAVLVNISTRLRVDTGDNVLIGGFIVTGTQPKKVLLRAIGPSLPFADKLADPFLELRDSSGALLETNDNWGDSANKQAIIDSTIPPSNNLESAILRSVPPGSYTAIMRGLNNGTGIGLVEAYDLDNSVDSKLANISTRGLVQTGDNVLIAGTIVLGQAPQEVIVRAIGPSLPIAGKMADPTLELRDGNGGLIRANDNWRTGGQETEIIQSTVPPTNDFESAIVATLPANGASYTAIVRGAGNATGVAVVEIYALN